MHVLPVLAIVLAANVGTTQHAINVTLLHEATLKRQAARAQSDAQVVRDRAAQCRDEFAAAPAAARKDLGAMYFNAVSGALWQTDRAGYESWVRRLAPAARASSAWRGARTWLRSNVTAANRIYGAAVDDPCAVVEAWQANGFDSSHPPDDVTTLRRIVRTTHVSGRPPKAIGTLLRGLGTASARRALAALDRGADEPDSKVIRRGDPVWAALT
jgi:hypothetical protein